MGRSPVNGSSKEKGKVMGLKRGPWSTEEDEKLIAYITRYGIWYWNHMAKPAGLARSGKSCRLRWMNYLRPNLKHGNFTKQEEDTIIRLQQLLGNRWSAIAGELPGRTDNEIKNYWNTRLKKRNESKLGRTNDTVSSTPQNSSSSEKIHPPKKIIYESLSPMSGSNTISLEVGSSISSEGSSAMKNTLMQDTAGSLQSFWDELHLPMLVDISSLEDNNISGAYYFSNELAIL